MRHHGESRCGEERSSRFVRARTFLAGLCRRGHIRISNATSLVSLKGHTSAATWGPAPRPTRCASPVYTTLSQLRSCQGPRHSMGSHAVELRSGNSLGLTAENQSIRNQYLSVSSALPGDDMEAGYRAGLAGLGVVGTIESHAQPVHASVNTHHAHNEGVSPLHWVRLDMERGETLVHCKPPLQPMSRCVRTLLRLERLLAPGPADS
jgi:hypothetical protein